MSKCNICKKDFSEGEFLKLKCNHSFCWLCIGNYASKNLAPKIKCPTENCEGLIRDKQIRSILSDEDILKYENLCLSGIKKVHKCILKDCSISIFYSDPNIQYRCPFCTLYNCISCNAAHIFTSCDNYQRMSTSEKSNFCQAEITRAMNALNRNKEDHTRELFLSLEQLDLITNDTAFICSICVTMFPKGNGIKLRNCSHNFCKSCLSEHISKTVEIPVTCPQSHCSISITDQEIRSILSDEEFERFYCKYNEFCAEKLVNHVTCKTPNCGVSYDCSTKPNEFTCGKCGKVNCVICEAVHSGKTCEEYQIEINHGSAFSLIQEKIKRRELMKCPRCKTYIQKSGGCDGVRCSNCSLEICWILQIPKWGPKGRWDNSGGCKCGVDFKLCHPDCKGCVPHEIDHKSGNRNASRNS